MLYPLSYEGGIAGRDGKRAVGVPPPARRRPSGGAEPAPVTRTAVLACCFAQ
jgi:hypothetical protein